MLWYNRSRLLVIDHSTRSRLSFLTVETCSAINPINPANLRATVTACPTQTDIPDSAVSSNYIKFIRFTLH